MELDRPAAVRRTAARKPFGNQVALQACGLVFLVEAAMHFFMEWSRCLAWLDPLLLGVGLLALGTPAVSPAAPGDGGPSARRVSGIAMIVGSFVLLCFRLARL